MTTRSTICSRRRFLTISAAAGGAALLPVVGRPAVAGTAAFTWRGHALGAAAEITIAHERESAAVDLIAMCLREVRRLEAIFSLYDPASALSRLNRDGFLSDPPPELVIVLDRSADIHRVTDGAFDPSVQPLWQAYASHFARTGADPSGPSASDLRAARNRVGFADVRITSRRIELTRPGAALTLNGIAQGYITDRVAERLKAADTRNVLINTGEIAAIGHRPDGEPWRLGVTDPLAPGKTFATVNAVDRAFASSGGYAAPFENSGRHHHIFDPATARSATQIVGATVAARDAATADALATAFAVLAPSGVPAVLNAIGNANAWITVADGSRFYFNS